jgi:hypothetical protein
VPSRFEMMKEVSRQRLEHVFEYIPGDRYSLDEVHIKACFYLWCMHLAGVDSNIKSSGIICIWPAFTQKSCLEQAETSISWPS